MNKRSREKTNQNGKDYNNKNRKKMNVKGKFNLTQ